MTTLQKNMLVTGAAGFIGCNFVQYMLAKYHDLKIVSLDKLTYAGNLKSLENLSNEKNHTFVHGDICDAKLLDEILQKHQINIIVHFAAESHVDRSITGPKEFVQTNVMGTFILLEAARKYAIRFHHISTDEVYGSLNPQDPAFCETTPYAPNSPYSASKAASDHLVRAYFHTYKLPVTTSNCSNNYGPYQHSEKLIPTIIRCCLDNKPIPIYGNGQNIRDWLYVEDHVAAIDLILNKGTIGEVYNVGGKNEHTNLSLTKAICAILDELKPSSKKYETLISFVTDRAGHDQRYAIDNTKIQTELGFIPKYDLTSGLRKTVEFYVGITSR